MKRQSFLSSSLLPPGALQEIRSQIPRKRHQCSILEALPSLLHSPAIDSFHHPALHPRPFFNPNIQITTLSETNPCQPTKRNPSMPSSAALFPPRSSHHGTCPFSSNSSHTYRAFIRYPYHTELRPHQGRSLCPNKRVP